VQYPFALITHLLQHHGTSVTGTAFYGRSSF
jgi:hypothetical protein